MNDKKTTVARRVGLKISFIILIFVGLQITNL